jgi:hypothetical protein
VVVVTWSRVASWEVPARCRVVVGHESGGMLRVDAGEAVGSARVSVEDSTARRRRVVYECPTVDDPRPEAVPRVRPREPVAGPGSRVVLSVRVDEGAEVEGFAVPVTEVRDGSEYARVLTEDGVDEFSPGVEPIDGRERSAPADEPEGRRPDLREAYRPEDLPEPDPPRLTEAERELRDLAR